MMRLTRVLRMVEDRTKQYSSSNSNDSSHVGGGGSFTRIVEFEI